jgi:type IV pilus assembly protein PilX
MNTLPNNAKQEGAALVVCLIILVLVTLMGLTTMKTSVLQEKISGGNSDKTLAMQAGEIALRAAETRIRDQITSTSDFTGGCNKGLCLPTANGVSMAETVDWNSASVVTFGKDGHTALSVGVANQPKYIIELLPEMMALPGNSIGMKSVATPYRITVLAYGRQDNTRVMLQSMFYKP